MTLIAVSYGGFYYLLVINGGPSSANSQETLRASAEALAENPKVAEAFANKSSSEINPAKIKKIDHLLLKKLLMHCL